MMLFMCSPISPFAVLKLLNGMHLQDLPINKGPTEGLFDLICDLYKSGRDGCRSAGISRENVKASATRLMSLSAQGLNIAGGLMNYLLASQAFNNFQQRQLPETTQSRRAPRKQSVRIEYIETSSLDQSSSSEERTPPRTRLRKRRQK